VAPVFALFALAVPLVARALCRRRLRKVRDAFADRLPETLQVLSSALRARHSFSASLSVVAADAEGPTRREFERIVADERLGVPLDVALMEVARRMDNPDLEQVALVAELQRQTGGNMAEVLDRVVETIRGRFDLRRLVTTLTAQGRMARWIVSLLPVFLFAVISVINPGYEATLYTSTGGQIALAVAALMVISGSFVIKRIVDIKV
jgi:tight adherence protein B